MRTSANPTIVSTHSRGPAASTGGLAVVALAALAALVGCGGGGGSSGGGGGTVTGGTPSTGPGTFKNLLIANYGAGISAPTPDDETPAPGHIASTIVFRKVNAASSYQGSPPGSFGGQTDETYGAVAVDAFYLSSFELTQAQWTSLVVAAFGGGPTQAQLTPWANVLPASETPPTSANLPATGMSYNLLVSVLVQYNTVAAKNMLRLPTNGEWEHAARAASTASYSWGATEDITTVSANAWVREAEVAAAIAPLALQNVGGKAKNAFGFFDMAGNAWEWVDSGGSPSVAIMRGGSCSDNLLSARCANKQYMDPAPGYAMAGVRLVLVP